jgi:hypothetical protein
MNKILLTIIIVIIINIFIRVFIENFSNIQIKQDLNINTLDDYIYYQTNDDEYIYYVNMLNHTHSSFFMDGNRNIINNSRYYFFPYLDDCDYNNMISEILNNITEDKLNDAIDVGENIISISKWFITYGHVQDEMYSLYDFYSKISKINPDINYKVLFEYHTDNEIINYPSKNYKLFHKYLFEDKLINPYDFKYNIIKMKKVIIINNNITDTIFHSFPKTSRNKILSKIPNDYSIMQTKNIFISRGKATHLSRNLENEDEVSTYLLSNNYDIINPEDVSLDQFINTIKNADNIIITWGGALTNMVYLKENANVYILKSRSYEHEDIALFSKIINTYKLNIKIIVHVDNKIVIPFL